MQALENDIQVVGVVATLQRDAFSLSLRFALGFCDFSRLATVICILHVPGFQLGFLELDFAKVDFGVFVLGGLFSLLGIGRLLAFFGSFRLLGLFLLLALLFGLFLPAHQQSHCGVIASFAAVIGEFRRVG